MTTPFPLGRKVEHDEESRNYPFRAKIVKHHNVIHDLPFTVLDQGDLGSCTGNAAAQCFNSALFRPVRRRLNKGRLLYEADAVKLYSLATSLDEYPNETYPPTDSGSSGLGVAKASKQLGYIDRYTHTFSFNAFCLAVQEQPVIVGTQWTNDMFNPVSSRLGAFAVPGALTQDNIAGGHEYLAIGINWDASWLRFRNSWGKNWGTRGDFYMSFGDFENLLKADGDATVLHGAGLP